MTKKMTLEEVSEHLNTLDGWQLAGDKEAIEKTFKFKTFNQAFAFMTRVAMKAEKMDHHPEWFNVYNRVDVTLCTHDANGISEKDFSLAAFMDKVGSS